MIIRETGFIALGVCANESNGFYQHALASGNTQAQTHTTTTTTITPTTTRTNAVSLVTLLKFNQILLTFLS